MNLEDKKVVKNMRTPSKSQKPHNFAITHTHTHTHTHMWIGYRWNADGTQIGWGRAWDAEVAWVWDVGKTRNISQTEEGSGILGIRNSREQI